MLKSAEHELKLLRNTDVAKIKGKFRFIHHIDWSFINYTRMSTIALNNTLMRRMKIDPGFWSRVPGIGPAFIPSHRIYCDLCELFLLLNFTYTFYQVCNRNNAFKSKKCFIFG